MFVEARLRVGEVCLYSIKQHGGDDQGVSVRRKNGLSSDANDENREVIRKA